MDACPGKKENQENGLKARLADADSTRVFISTGHQRDTRRALKFARH